MLPEEILREFNQLAEASLDSSFNDALWTQYYMAKRAEDWVDAEKWVEVDPKTQRAIALTARIHRELIEQRISIRDAAAHWGAVSATVNRGIITT